MDSVMPNTPGRMVMPALKINPINTLRHLSVFDPVPFGQKRVDVIGAGATGSRIAIQLAKLGINNLHVWDFDKVESHNIANQMFTQKDIGKTKVSALADQIKEHSGLQIVAHEEKVDGKQQLGEIIFLLTDTMSSRKEIWKAGIKLKLNVKLLVETRMGADSGRVYAFNPCQTAHCREWEKTLTDDAVAEQSACGGSITIGPTADVLAGLAVWQFIKWFRKTQGDEDLILENEIIYSLRPAIMLSRNFSA
jgi:molybdopterin/thiamine biosynthesis adenylyltransferase